MDNNKIEDAQIIETITNESETQITAPSVEPVKQSVPVNKVVNASNVSIINIDKQTGKPDLSKYTPDQIEKYTKMGNMLKSSDANSILNYGAELQNKLSGYSDQFLSGVRSFDAGEIASSINDLLAEVNYIDIDPSQDSGFKRLLMAIPGIKHMVMSSKKIFQKYDTVSHNIDGIVKKLDLGRLTIAKDNNQLQVLFEQNVDYILQLEELIVSGHIKLDELTKEIAEMESHPENYQDYEISDKKEFANRLSKRLADMSMTRIITIQSLPQIRMVQNNNVSMAEKIQSSIHTTIPIWKNQIALTVAMMRQGKILEVQEKITDTTNKILEKNSQMLKINSIKVAKQNEEGIVKVETLRQVNQDLISTLNEIKRIKDEGEAARKNIGKEMEALELELKRNVLQISEGPGKTNY